MSTNNNLPQNLENRESTPLDAASQAVTAQIDRLLALQASLVRAKMAGLTVIPLEDPITGEIRQVAVDIAIEAIDFVANLKGGE